MSAAVSLPEPTLKVEIRPARAWRHWTAHEDNVIAMGWGLHPVERIAADLGRSPNAVYRRGAELGLGAGCPQGFEYESQAAERTGFGRATFRRILHWARVTIRPAASLPGSVGHEHIVEPSEADRAVAAWCACETLAQAGVRFGFSACTLGLWLNEDADAGLISLPPRSHKSWWRIPRTTFDEVVARRLARESGTDAARRVGVAWITLRKWMFEAGVKRPPGNLWFVDREVVDRIVEEKRAANNLAFRMKKKTAGGTT